MSGIKNIFLNNHLLLNCCFQFFFCCKIWIFSQNFHICTKFSYFHKIFIFLEIFKSLFQNLFYTFRKINSIKVIRIYWRNSIISTACIRLQFPRRVAVYGRNLFYRNIINYGWIWRLFSVI